MSESLLKSAGERLRKTLSIMTSNKLRGFSTGLLITSGIQSSSATTVLVVSFVNAGLISLTGATAIIFGANIGTTITGWLVALLGYKFQIATVALPILGIAIPLYFSGKSKFKNWGEFIIGFVLLFISLQFLKDSLPKLDEIPALIDILSKFSDVSSISVILYILAGMFITILFQSSSATMTLTLVMASQGLIGLDHAAAMILGENIGTTFTANFAAIVANNTAKMAARIHFIINGIGVLWAVFLLHPLLLLIDNIVISMEGSSAFTNVAIVPITLAMFHTAFNILNTLLLIGFSPILIKTSKYLVSDEKPDNKKRLKHIESTILSTSELAIVQVKNEITTMITLIIESMNALPLLMTEKQPKKYKKLLKKIESNEQIINQLEEQIGLYLITIANKNISAKSSGELKTMLKLIDELENIGDYCDAIAKTIKQKNKDNIWFTQELRNNLTQIFSVIIEAMHLFHKNFIYYRQKYAEKITPYALEQEINSLRNRFRDEHYKNIEKAEYSYQAGVAYISILNQLEKIGDHILNAQNAISETYKL